MSPLLRTLLLLSLVLGICFVRTQPPIAHANTIIVDGTTCTLPNAIIAANADTATGGCSAGSGADTITLNTNFATNIPYAGSSNVGGGQSALPDITSTITLQAGTANTLQRTNGNVAPYFRVLYVANTGNLILNSIIVRGGYIQTFSDEAIGGGIYALGSLTINGATITQNIIEGDGAIGGGIFASGSLSVDNSTISANQASDLGSNSASGGGIATGSTIPAVISNSTITGNTIDSFGVAIGGGLMIGRGSITNSLIANNIGYGEFFGFGGGIAGETPLTISYSTISNNNISNGNEDGDGGGIFVSDSGTGVLAIHASIIEANIVPTLNYASGVGLFADAETIITDSLFRGNTSFAEVIVAGSAILATELTMTNTTISNNYVQPDSIGFAVAIDGSATIQSSTIVNNTNTVGIATGSGSATVLSSIIYNNEIDCDGTISSLGYNIVQNPENCNFTATGDQVGVDPLLAPLANNGGFTQTHALLSNSPAIDNGTCANGTITTDQRGVGRPFDFPSIPNADDGCDIGAFERDTLSNTPTLTNTPITPTDTPTNTPITPTDTLTNTPITTTQTPTACVRIATAPTLITPQHRTHTTDRRPRFAWTNVPNAQSYRFMIYTEDRSFEFKKRVFVREYTMETGLARGSKYLWRVRTQDQTCSTWSGWSQRHTLFVD